MKMTVKLAMAVSVGLVLTFGSGSAQANLFGIDVSNWQGWINWPNVYGDGARYAFAKATEGNYYQDPQFRNNMVNGKAAGMQMGAYDFARPDLFCPNTEADYFWNYAGGYIIADGKSVYPMVDFEVYNGAACAANYTAWFNAWASRVKSKTARFLRPVIYSSECAGLCYLIEWDLPGGIQLSAWVANYNGQNLYTGHPWTTCPCCNAWQQGCGAANWTYWQVSSTGRINGVSGNCDFDAYAGTLQNLKDWQGVH